MKKIAVLNVGSSTWKCALFPLNVSEKQPIWKGQLEKRGKEYAITSSSGNSHFNAHTYHEASNKFLKFALASHDIIAFGHRIVHGGEKFIQPLKLNSKNIEQLKKISHLAPLHNPFNLQGIEWAEEFLPKALQIAVFDTAFHHTIPRENYTYPIPKLLTKKGIRRYGFHGLSHESCYDQLKKLGEATDKIVTCHLGNGASLCAIKNGQSLDTTMGFTPMEGLMMGTRSGSIDPGIIFYLLRKNQFSPTQLEEVLNKESGLKALGGSNDIREIKDPFAIEVYCHILVKNIVSMAASLQGIQTLVFTGGIGENSAVIRQKACESLSFLNLHLDEKKNNDNQVGLISTKKSGVKIFILKTEEEYTIAKAVKTFLT